MPNKLLLTYKFRAFFSLRKDRRRQLFLDINNAMLVLFFGFNYVQAGDSRRFDAGSNGWKVVN